MKSNLLNIGASVEAIQEARRSILDILNCRVGDDVTIEALQTFKVICEVKNATISGCNFNGCGLPQAVTTKKESKHG